MENFKYALDGAWQVLVIGIVLGAGLPAIFALGIRSLAIGASGAAGAAVTAGGSGTGGSAVGGSGDAPGATALGKALAGLCFLIVIAAVAVGIAIIVASGLGKEVSFSHVYPTIVAKAS